MIPVSDPADAGTEKLERDPVIIAALERIEDRQLDHGARLERVEGNQVRMLATQDHRGAQLDRIESEARKLSDGQTTLTHETARASDRLAAGIDRLTDYAARDIELKEEAEKRRRTAEAAASEAADAATAATNATWKAGMARLTSRETAMAVAGLIATVLALLWGSPAKSTSEEGRSASPATQGPTP